MTEDCPEGWEFVRLGQITSKVGSGSTPRGGSESYQQTGIPLIRSMNVRFEGFTKEGLAFLNQRQADALKEATVSSDDVLLNITGASIGRVTQAPPFMDGARVNQHVCIIRPLHEIDAAYLSRYLASPSVQQMIWGEQYGVTRQALTKAQILDFQIPLAPPNEQRRIVETIDALCEQVNSARNHLSRVPAILKRFRQAVLAAACSGKLTEDWRKTNQDEVGADECLATSLKLREKLWLEREVEKQERKAGSKGAKGRIRRYEEPFVPTLALLEGELPLTWVPATISQVALLDVGFAFPSAEFTENGIRLLRGENVEPGSLRWLDVDCWPPERMQGFEHLIVQEGESILAMDRPVISAGLKLARAKPDDVPCLLVQRVMRFKVPNAPVADFLHLCLQTADFLKHVSGGLTGSDLPHITGTNVAEYTFGLPPLAEQQEIGRRVLALMALAEAISKRVEQAAAKSDKLTQSILAKAFRGELVPTEAELARREGREYEPASVLLERIRKERESHASSKPERKRTRTKSKLATAKG